MSSNVIFDVRNFTKTVWTPTNYFILSPSASWLFCSITEAYVSFLVQVDAIFFVFEQHNLVTIVYIVYKVMYLSHEVKLVIQCFEKIFVHQFLMTILNSTNSGFI